MSYSSYEKAIRALVEGGLRMINNMIPDAPSPRQIQQTIKPNRPAAPAAPSATAVQRRLNVPLNVENGRFQRQLPVPYEVPAGQIPRRAGYPQADVPRESLPVRTPGVAPGQRSLPIGQDIPASTTVRPYAIPSSPQAPEPTFAYGKELMRRDPEGYGRIRSIVETTAAERGVNADEVMEALLSTEGFDSPLIRQLEASPNQFMTRGGEMVRSPGGGMAPPTGGALTAGATPGGGLTRGTTGGMQPAIEPVNVYEVSRAQQALPEGDAMRPMSDALGGVNMVDLRQALATPEFLRNVAPALERFATGPAAAAAAEGGAAAARRIPAGPVIGTAMLGGLGLGAFLSGQQGSQQQAVDAAFGAPAAPGQTSLGAPTATVEAGANLPAVTGTPQVTAPAQPIAGSTNAIPGTVNPSSTTPIGSPAAPITRAPLGGQASAPVASAMGGGSVPQLMNSADSDYRQAVQNAAQGLRQDASQYKNIGDFYRVQSAYANAPGRPEQIIGALKGMGAPASVGIESEANLESWAKANPELAYRLQLQMQRRGPSQQMPTAQGAALGTSMGFNNTNNAAGQARAAAINAAFGTQGAADLNATLAPQAYQTIERAPLF
jgi:hypothetical protein